MPEFPTETQRLLDRHGTTLLQVAAWSIGCGLRYGVPCRISADDYEEDLRRAAASFVTLHRNGQLRGCIGTAEARRPLVEDVAWNGYAAAFCDPRFPPLTPAEPHGLDVSVSVLSEPSLLVFSGEQDLLEQLRPGEDGLIIRAGDRRALFLPQVWQDLPTPRQFLRCLKLKAGLPEDYWSSDVAAWRFASRSVSGDSDSLAAMFS